MSEASVTVEDGIIFRTTDDGTTEVGVVYPTTLGWQSMRSGWFVSRRYATRSAAVRALLADQGYDPSELSQ